MCVPAGDEQRLIALLRERGSTALFNAALRRVPIIQMLALLDVLPRHMGEGSKLSGSSGSELSSMRSISSSSGEPSNATSSGDSGGSSGGTWRGTLRPDDATARILLERLPASELHWELDSALDKLLGAGIKPHYHLFLPWATLHANVRPQGRCGGGRCGGVMLRSGGPPPCHGPSQLLLLSAADTSTAAPTAAMLAQAGRPQAVRKVMERVERYTGTLAPHYYAQLIKVRAGWAAGVPAAVAASAGWALAGLDFEAAGVAGGSWSVGTTAAAQTEELAEKG